MSREEVQIACDIALANGRNFTEDMFQQNIQRFRNLLQTSTPYNMGDFNSFLRKLNASKMFAVLQGDNGQQFGYLRDSNLVEKLQALQDFEYNVFCTIETAGNKGIWTADMRKALGLPVQRAVKNLSEVARLIKPVTNVHYKNRKLFILSSLEPSSCITGGSFYCNGEFNHLLVEKMQEQISLYLSKNIASTIDDIIKHLKATKLIHGDLTENDVYSVIKILILENKVYTSVKNQDYLFIWCGNEVTHFYDVPFGVPCFQCDMVDSCNFGLVHKICPSNCKYLDRWLESSHT